MKRTKLRNAFYGAIGGAVGSGITSYAIHHAIEQAIYVGAGVGIVTLVLFAGFILMGVIPTDRHNPKSN